MELLTAIAVCDAFAQQKVTQALHRILLGCLDGIYDIVLALRHLLTIHCPVRVNMQLARRFQAGGQQKGGPIDAVEFQYVLSNDLLRRRPMSQILQIAKIRSSQH